MSLDVYLMKTQPCQIYQRNITHNLSKMAREARLYEYLWRPDENGVTTAKQLIGPLRKGLDRLVTNPDKFKQFNPPNKWGDYEGLVKMVREYLAACEDNPDAMVEVSR